MVYRLPAMISFLKLLLFLWFPWQHIVLGVLLFPLSLIILAGPSSSSQTWKARIPQLCTVFSLFILPSIDRWSQLLLWLQLPSVSQWQTNLYLQWLRHPDQWGWGPAGHQTSHNCFKGMIRHSTFSSLPPSPKKKKKKKWPHLIFPISVNLLPSTQLAKLENEQSTWTHASLSPDCMTFI